MILITLIIVLSYNYYFIQPNLLNSIIHTPMIMIKKMKDLYSAYFFDKNTFLSLGDT
jgi:hypothetical protein